MSWAQEQIIKAANIVFDFLMKSAVTDIQAAKAQDLYYTIQKYKAESRRVR